MITEKQPSRSKSSSRSVEYLEAHVASKRKDFHHCPRGMKCGLMLSDSPLEKRETYYISMARHFGNKAIFMEKR